MLSKPNDLANWYLELAKNAESKIKEGTFEVLEHQTNVKVMGPTIFSDYSKVMDKTMSITKWCLLGDAGLFAMSIFLEILENQDFLQIHLKRMAISL